MIPDFPIDIRIRLAELKFFLLLPDFANFLPGWPAQFWWDSQQGRELAKSGSKKKEIQFCQSYSYVNRKVWYHQIWIPNNLGFMVLILTYLPTMSNNFHPIFGGFFVPPTYPKIGHHLWTSPKICQLLLRLWVIISQLFSFEEKWFRRNLPFPDIVARNSEVAAK